MQLQSKFSIWQPLIYLIMIGFTLIAMPKTGNTYLVARCVQAIEVVVCITLFIQYFRQKIQLNGFNWRTNLWWLFYTYLAYAFTSAGVGLTPLFKWLNIIIFLLMGVCYWQHDPNASFKYISIILSFLIYLNAILLFLYPDGLWYDYEWIGGGDSRRYLFGNYNQMGFVCLLGVTSQSIYTFATRRWKFNLFLLMIISLWTVMFVGSMTSTVGLSILGAYILLHKFIKRPKIYLAIFVFTYIAFFVIIVWAGHSIENIDLITRFVEDVLSKDTTFTRRTDIWENAVYKIQQNPWIGYGTRGTEWNMSNIGGSGTHNLWLSLLLQGGIILFCAFIYHVIFVIRNAFRKQTSAGILGVVALCVFFLMSLFEAYNMIQTFFFLQLIYYSPSLSITDINDDAN